ncbi:MAG: hypothetical protein DRO09_00420 [Thermoprotei archaeon]|nr:MAG: hypothetical protein DRO09_00420 [Thermoprotei archaeon]
MSSDENANKFKERIQELLGQGLILVEFDEKEKIARLWDRRSHIVVIVWEGINGDLIENHVDRSSF